MNAGAFAAPRLFTVAEYYRMTEAGIFGEDDRVELIEGEVVAMSPIGSRHAACVERLWLSSAAPCRMNRFRCGFRIMCVSVSTPSRCRTCRLYADVVLLIEVADASLMYDRHTG